MAEQLTTEQVLLLNNLMYTSKNPPLRGIADTDAKTIKQFINKIETEDLVADKDYGSYMTGEDWQEIITAVKNDEQLMNLQIADTHIADGSNGGGGGVSALFVDPSTNEAIVTFRGTASLEWKDNFVGGGPTGTEDGVSTPYQENALDWYQSLDLSQYGTITVTGHSKGGNKAKYITVMDDSVDRCLSFDGQGFSDEFIKEYQEQIAANQDKITNHNVEDDYVNILLNDIGNTSYYKGYGQGEGGFLENHCPNTFFDFKPDGTFQMVEGSQDKRLAELDEFLNNYLRTLSPEDKQATLAMIGELVEGGFNGANVNQMLDILLEDNNVDMAANLAAYLLEYKEENPELVEAINSVLTEMGLDNVVETVNMVVDITNWEHFEQLADALGWLSGNIPDFVYGLLQDWLKEKGIELSKAELEKLLSMIQKLADDMDDVEIADNGEDMVVPVANKVDVTVGTSSFTIFIEKNRRAEEELENCGKQLQKYAKEIDAICGRLDSDLGTIKEALKTIRNGVEREAWDCQLLKETLCEIHRCYEMTEKRISVLG